MPGASLRWTLHCGCWCVCSAPFTPIVFALLRRLPRTHSLVLPWLRFISINLTATRSLHVWFAVAGSALVGSFVHTRRAGLRRASTFSVAVRCLLRLRHLAYAFVLHCTRFPCLPRLRFIHRDAALVAPRTNLRDTARRFVALRTRDAHCYNVYAVYRRNRFAATRVAFAGLHTRLPHFRTGLISY